MIPTLTILEGDWIARLRELPDASVQCCVTSPPYFGLRNYGVSGQVGLEKSPAEYVATLVAGFREVRRVLRDDGTLWLNLGDSYAASGRGGGGGSYQDDAIGKTVTKSNSRRTPVTGYKQKDLLGIPWRVAFALQSDGWYLRSEITWCKKVPMPESVIDRPTSATEKIFLLTKNSKYFYDADAVRNRAKDPEDDVRRLNQQHDQNKSMPDAQKNGLRPRPHKSTLTGGLYGRHHLDQAIPEKEQMANGSNMRNFWLLGPEPYAEAHFATFPTEVPKRCILAGSKTSDTILDPFGGSGTTGMVAQELGRNAILIELNPAYAALARKRCHVTPGLPL